MAAPNYLDRAVEVPSFTVDEPTEPTYVRAPTTAFPLVVAGALLAQIYVLASRSGDHGFDTAFGELLGSIPSWIVNAVAAVSQIGFALPALLGFIGLVVTRRFARVWRLLLGVVVVIGALLLAERLIGSDTFPVLPGPGGGPGRSTAAASGGPGPSGQGWYGIGGPFPTTLDFGIVLTMIFVDRAHWSGRWRRVGWVVACLGILGRLVVGLADPGTIVAAVLIAILAKSVVELALGSLNTRPRGRVVGEILESLGYPVASVERFGSLRGSIRFRVMLTDGRRFYAKVVSRDSLAVLLPARLYQVVRFRDPGQDRPFRSIRTQVEHEALCALKAHSDGIPTVRVAALADFPPNAMMMAFESKPYVPLAEVESDLDPDEIAGIASGVWSIVRGLQDSHMVHHRLNVNSLLVGEDGDVAVVEFQAAALGVTDSTLSADVAEVLAATAARFGNEQAVKYAIAALGPEPVADCLPRLQPLALTPPTRSAIKAAGDLEGLRAEVQRVTGTEVVPIAELERVKSRTIGMLAMVALALWALIPQLVGTGSVWSQFGELNWWYAAAALAISATTYVAAAISFEGSTPIRVPLGPSIGVHLATSFVGVAVPGGVLALRVRFLQKRGLDAAAAVAAVSVDTMGGVIVHVALLAMFVSFAGTSGLKTFNLPSALTVGIVVGAFAAVCAIVTAIPWTRAQIATRVMPATRRSVASAREVARQPAKMLALFGGSIGITLGYIMALEVAVAGFGAGPAFTSVALVYLAGTAVANLAPTPGGIGAVEAVLIAGLVSAGMESASAVAAVMLFRLATFWLPLLPGWGAFVALERAGEL